MRRPVLRRGEEEHKKLLQLCSNLQTKRLRWSKRHLLPMCRKKQSGICCRKSPSTPDLNHYWSTTSSSCPISDQCWRRRCSIKKATDGVSSQRMLYKITRCSTTSSRRETDRKRSSETERSRMPAWSRNCTSKWRRSKHCKKREGPRWKLKDYQRSYPGMSRRGNRSSWLCQDKSGLRRHFLKTNKKQLKVG